METIALVIQLGLLIAEKMPSLAPKVKEMFDLLKGKAVEDITQEELEIRINMAIAKLPVWE